MSHGARRPHETRRQLVESAVELLRGLSVADLVSALGTRVIAQRAGVSAATLFHHFGSVEGFAEALLARVYDPDTSPVDEINAKVVDIGVADLPAETGLALHRSEFNRVLEDREHRVRVGLWAFGGDEARAAYGHYVRTSDARIEVVAARLYTAWGREVRPPFDLTMFIAAQAALLSGSVIRYVADPSATDVDRFARTAAALSLVMLRTPGDRHTLDDRLAEINYYAQNNRGRVVGERRDRTRQLVLGAAATLFERVGYDNASIAMVAREAHVSLSTVYAMVDGKADLATVTLMHEARRLLGDLAPIDDVEGLERRLGEVAQVVAARSSYAAPYVGALATGQRIPGDDAFVACVQAAVLDAQRAGVGFAGLDAHDVADTLTVALLARVMNHPAGGASGAVDHIGHLLDKTPVRVPG